MYVFCMRIHTQHISHTHTQTHTHITDTHTHHRQTDTHTHMHARTHSHTHHTQTTHTHTHTHTLIQTSCTGTPVYCYDIPQSTMVYAISSVPMLNLFVCWYM